jgi:hypothetical protein
VRREWTANARRQCLSFRNGNRECQHSICRQQADKLECQHSQLVATHRGPNASIPDWRQHTNFLPPTRPFSDNLPRKSNAVIPHLDHLPRSPNGVIRLLDDLP